METFNLDASFVAPIDGMRQVYDERTRQAPAHNSPDLDPLWPVSTPGLSSAASARMALVSTHTC